MPTFSPSGNLYLGTVPFDNSYKHVMWFDSIQEQENYLFQAVRPAAGDGTYKYIRRENAIQVPINAEQLNNINYCAYKNTNYGNKWFYCFVTNIEYINANTTRLFIETDIFQTWLFDWNHNEAAFIAREHVSDDSIGLHVNQEPPMWMEYVSIHMENILNDCRYVCVQTTVYPYQSSGGASRTYNVSLPAYPLFGIAQGAATLVWDLDDSDALNDFRDTMERYTYSGCADSIISIYMLPSDAIGYSVFLGTVSFDIEGTTITLPYCNMLRTSSNQLNYSYINMRYAMDTGGNFVHGNGYVPLNNKMFVYPYMYFELGDYSGRVTDYKYELSEYSDASGKAVHLANRFSPLHDGSGYVWPINYAGNSGNTQEELFTYNTSLDCSWTGSEYAYWKMINKEAMSRELEFTQARNAFNLVTGIAANVANMANVANKDGSGIAELLGSGVGIVQTIGDFAFEQTKSQMEYDNADLRASRVPNHAKGNVTGDSRIAAGLCGFYWRQVGLFGESAKIIDDYFSMFGYSIDRIKVPNFHSRANWNFVKTVNANFSGVAPQYALNFINKIFDSGVTLWHHGAVGDYLHGDQSHSRPLNPIVS